MDPNENHSRKEGEEEDEGGGQPNRRYAGLKSEEDDDIDLLDNTATAVDGMNLDRNTGSTGTGSTLQEQEFDMNEDEGFIVMKKKDSLLEPEVDAALDDAMIEVAELEPPQLEPPAPAVAGDVVANPELLSMLIHELRAIAMASGNYNNVSAMNILNEAIHYEKAQNILEATAGDVETAALLYWDDYLATLQQQQEVGQEPQNLPELHGPVANDMIHPLGAYEEGYSLQRPEPEDGVNRTASTNHHHNTVRQQMKDAAVAASKQFFLPSQHQHQQQPRSPPEPPLPPRFEAESQRPEAPLIHNADFSQIPALQQGGNIDVPWELSNYRFRHQDQYRRTRAQMQAELGAAIAALDCLHENSSNDDDDDDDDDDVDRQRNLDDLDVMGQLIERQFDGLRQLALLEQRPDDSRRNRPLEHHHQNIDLAAGLEPHPNHQELRLDHDVVLPPPPVAVAVNRVQDRPHIHNRRNQGEVLRLFSQGRNIAFLDSDDEDADDDTDDIIVRRSSNNNNSSKHRLLQFLRDSKNENENPIVDPISVKRRKILKTKRANDGDAITDDDDEDDYLSDNDWMWESLANVSSWTNVSLPMDLLWGGSYLNAATNVPTPTKAKTTTAAADAATRSDIMNQSKIIETYVTDELGRTKKVIKVNAQHYHESMRKIAAERKLNSTKKSLPSADNIEPSSSLPSLVDDKVENGKPMDEENNDDDDNDKNIVNSKDDAVAGIPRTWMNAGFHLVKAPMTGRSDGADSMTTATNKTSVGCDASKVIGLAVLPPNENDFAYLMWKINNQIVMHDMQQSRYRTIVDPLPLCCQL